jgi:hypothetical protein
MEIYPEYKPKEALIVKSIDYINYDYNSIDPNSINKKKLK